MYRDDINETTNISYQNYLDRTPESTEAPTLPNAYFCRLDIVMYLATGIPKDRSVQDTDMHRTIPNDSLFLQLSG